MESRLVFFMSGLLMLFITSCNYEFGEINPTYAVPLANSRLSVYDLLAQDSSDLVSSENGLVVLSYSDSIQEIVSTDILRLLNQDTTVKLTYNGPTRNPFPAGNQETFSGSLLFDYNSARGELLYKILYRRGAFVFKTTSAINNEVIVRLAVPHLQSSSLPFSLSDTIAPGSTGTARRIIDTYTLDLTKTPKAFNQFAINYTVTVVSTGAPLNNGSSVDLKIDLTEQIYEEVEAYLGSLTIPVAEDSVVIKLFQHTDEGRTSGTFALTDPRLTLTFENSFTIPMQGAITKLCAKEKISGEEDNILGNFANPFNIKYPLVPGNIEVTSIELNRDNSNLEEVISPVEKTLRYSASIITNPSGPAINKINRLSKLRTKAEIKIPLAGYGSNWVLSDTVELGINAASREQIESLILHLNINNKFPFDAGLQLYFLDEENKVIDTLLQSEATFIRSGVLDASGKVIQVTNAVTNIDLSPSKTDVLFTAKKIAINAVISTFKADQQQEIRIYDDYFIDVQLGVKTQLKVNP